MSDVSRRPLDQSSLLSAPELIQFTSYTCLTPFLWSLNIFFLISCQSLCLLFFLYHLIEVLSDSRVCLLTTTIDTVSSLCPVSNSRLRVGHTDPTCRRFLSTVYDKENATSLWYSSFITENTKTYRACTDSPEHASSTRPTSQNAKCSLYSLSTTADRSCSFATQTQSERWTSR